ncbi:MAG: hypothetical protein U5N86_12300 [Planctomycetota bacterium]|nr:hypothetical protein [Planctomycetota bacterium]
MYVDRNTTKLYSIEGKFRRKVDGRIIDIQSFDRKRYALIFEWAKYPKEMSYPVDLPPEVREFRVLDFESRK